MRAGDPGKRIGRADKVRQLAGHADAPRELFFSRRSFCAGFSPIWFGGATAFPRAIEHMPRHTVKYDIFLLPLHASVG